MPAPALDFISLRQKIFLFRLQKTLDFFNELCYNKDNEMNRREPK